MSLYVDITKKFKDFSLEVSFETRESVLGILGASGCGKSMTLKCIAGIETPDKGKIVLNGRTLFDSEKKINLKPQKRRVGYLFQDYALFPNKTVEENIRCVLKKSRKHEAEKWIRLFRLSGLEKLYPSQLSGGQKQRTALARMMAAEPELLLLDEPFSALDSHLKEQLQLQMLELLGNLDKDMILVTHNRDEAYRLCPGLLILDKGKKVCQGDTRLVFEHPEYLEAARITGCKNFSRIRKIDTYHAYAADWGVSLQTAEPIEEGEMWAGIRAHSFQTEMKEGQGNLFPVYVKETVESPFEMYVLFQAEEGERPLESLIWWKISKEIWRGKLKEQVPDRIWIRPADIMLLKSKKGINMHNS